MRIILIMHSAGSRQDPKITTLHAIMVLWLERILEMKIDIAPLLLAT